MWCPLGEVELHINSLADLEQQIGPQEGPAARHVGGRKADRPPDLLGGVRDHHRNFQLARTCLRGVARIAVHGSQLHRERRPDLHAKPASRATRGARASAPRRATSIDTGSAAPPRREVDEQRAGNDDRRLGRGVGRHRAADGHGGAERAQLDERAGRGAERQREPLRGVDAGARRSAPRR